MAELCDLIQSVLKANLVQAVDKAGLAAPLTGHGKTTGHPKVVISYQPADRELMVRLRDVLNNRGIDTVDGSQTPAGADW